MGLPSAKYVANHWFLCAQLAFRMQIDAMVFNGPLRAMRVIRYEALQFTSHFSNFAARSSGGDGELGDTVTVCAH